MSSSGNLRESLYFGDFPIALSPVAGRAYGTAGADLKVLEATNEDGKAEAIFRMETLASLGEEYSEVLVNCIPSHDVVSSAADGSCPLATPLIKTADGPTAAVRSGGRSAIMKDGETGDWIRLKGCGNYVDDEGFRFDYPGIPVQDVEVFGMKRGIEIRGVCFEHTALREEYMAGRIAALLEPHGLTCGNSPLGWWVYEIPEAPLPAVEKYCALFKTVGEKRLASHLLAGLELLLPLIVPNVPEAEIDAVFGAERMGEDGLPRATFSACNTGSSPMEPGDFSRVVLGETAPAAEDVIALCAEHRVSYEAVVAEATSALAAAIDALAAAGDAAPTGSLLTYLYRRLGAEVGFFKALLLSNDISWGYYIDHNEFEPHCNAHPNNYVVVAQPYDSTGVNQLLAPVDFDMAFEKENFFSTVRDTPTFGQHDPELFDSWVNSETKELANALGGEEANTGLLGLDGGSSLSLAHTKLRWALRDTIFAAYKEGLQAPSWKAAEESEVTASLEPGIRALIDLALVLSTSRQS